MNLRVGLARAALAAGLVLGVGYVYAQTYAFPFSSMDDTFYVVDNDHVRAGLTRAGLAWAFTTLEAANWHPLTWASWMLDVSLFGHRPGPMHLVNAAWHAANALLAWWALARLTRDPWRSAWVSALFAFHPMRVESVAWISERKDVLSAAFGLLALVAYEAHARRPGLGRYLLLVAAFGASLMAKPMLVTLPFLLLLLDVWPLRRAPWPAGAPGASPGWRVLALEKLPLVTLSAAVSVLAFRAQQAGGAVVTEASVRPYANAIASYGRYLVKLLWPADLSVFYPMAHQGEPALAVAGWAAVLLGTTAAALAAGRRVPAVAVGWLWFMGSLVPVIGLVQVGSQAMADRYTYWPSLGLAVAVVWGLGALPWRAARRAAMAAGVIALGASLVTAHRQAALWRDDAVLFVDALRTSSPNSRVHHMLANVLREQGKHAEALPHLIESVKIFANAVNLTALGSTYLALGQRVEAEVAFRFAQSVDPAFVESGLALGKLLAEDRRGADAAKALLMTARAARPLATDLEREVELATLLVDLGETDEGARVLEQAAARAPENPELQSSLSEAYFHGGRRDLAARTAQNAIRLGARSGGAYLVLGATHLDEGRPAEAAEVLAAAVRLEPDEPFRRLPLADALLALGRAEEACAHWRFVLGAPRAAPSDLERARRGVAAARCP